MSAFDAAVHVLTADLVDEWTSSSIDRDARTIDWEEIKRNAVYLSHGGEILVEVAKQLWNGSRAPLIGGQPVTFVDVLTHLDADNFARVIEAMQIHRGVN